MSKRIGLIAGNRRLPIVVAEAARKSGCYVVAAAIKGDTSACLRRSVDKIYWLGLDEFNRMFKLFKDEGISEVLMAGQVSPKRLFSKEVNNSPQLQELLSSIKDKKADTIFKAVADKLEENGLKLLDSSTFVKDLMPPKGTLTKLEPDFRVWEDVYFGLELAKAIAYLDIGQTVAVKSKAVIAVEALEGTDNLIRRAGRIGKAGVTIVKVDKPKQDSRFDIPVVGLNTISNLIKIKAASLAIEAGKTLFIDMEESLKLANRRGLSIVAV